MIAKTILLLITPWVLLHFPESNYSKMEDKTMTVGQINFSNNPEGSERIEDMSNGEELKMLGLINTLRKKKGLNALTLNTSLQYACRYHAADMANEGYFEHDTYNRIDGDLELSLGAFERCKRFYQKDGYVNSENIAAGDHKASDAFELWLNSPGHYQNMLNKEAKSIGLGYYHNEDSEYGDYWVMETATQ
jgi:uncharacterized protein YkwD